MIPGYIFLLAAAFFGVPVLAVLFALINSIDN